MKTIAIILFFSISLSSQDFIKPFKINEQDRFFIDTIYVDSNITKDAFYNKSKIWIAKAFIDGKEVDIFSDEEKGQIIGKGSIEVVSGLASFTSGKDYLNYTINIYCKDGRARLVIDNIFMYMPENPYAKEPIAIETYYFKGGDVKGKQFKGKKKFKENKVEHVNQVIQSWIDSINSDGGYSDF